MALYLYAFTDRSTAPLPATPGLEDAPLQRIIFQDIAAVVSPVSGSRMQPTEDNLWRHEEIVETLMVDRALLPVRFGTVLADQAAAHSVLVRHYENLVSALVRVRGYVELSVRVLWNGKGGQRQTNSGQKTLNAPGAAVDGRTYLMARLEQQRQEQTWQQQVEALAAELHTPLAELAADNTQRILITPRMLLTGAYLVRRGLVDAFRQEVEALGTAHPGLRFLCTGPWPPYSFVTTAVPAPTLDTN